MDHNNSSKQYLRNRCAHGQCLDHDPEWENVGKERFEPYPDIFGLKTFLWGYRCCGKRMARRMKVQTQSCKKCGRIRNLTRADGELYALCQCCGYHYLAKKSLFDY